jgi:imidazolonepropionase-like amidohydrolase
LSRDPETREQTMADVAGPAGAAGKMVIRNVGLMLSGDLARPILDADAIVAVDGRIQAVGRAGDLDLDRAKVVIDARGCAVSPGLIDSHAHAGHGLRKTVESSDTQACNQWKDVAPESGTHQA